MEFIKHFQVEERRSTLDATGTLEIEGLTFDQLKAITLNRFMENPPQQKEQPNIFHSLIKPSESRLDSIIRNKITGMKGSMVDTNSKLADIITRLNDKIFSLEQTCKA